MPSRTSTLKHLRILLLLGPALLFAPPARAQHDWPEFRGPTGQGIAVDADPPLRWSPTENVAWKTEIPGSGWSSPVVYRGRVYLTTALTDAAGDPTSLRAICVDAQSGDILWDREVFSPAGGAPKHSKNTHASSTPVSVDGDLYVHFGHLGTARLTLDGEVIWRQSDLAYDPAHGNGSSPVVVGDKLIFNCDAARDPFVVALHRSTGKVAWKVPRRTDAAKKFSFSTPLVIDDGPRQLFISPGSGAVGAHDPETGREVWRVEYGQGYSVVPRPVRGEDTVYISSGFDSASVYAIRTGGRGDVTATHVLWKTARGAPKTPSMLLVGDELYFVSDNGIATCVDARSGSQHWQQRIGRAVSASPVYAAGRIYIMTEEGNTIVIAAGTQFDKLAENDLAERILASPAIADNSLYIRSASHLYRIADQ